jgi:hypothetical protein
MEQEKPASYYLNIKLAKYNNAENNLLYRIIFMLVAFSDLKLQKISFMANRTFNYTMVD